MKPIHGPGVHSQMLDQAQAATATLAANARSATVTKPVVVLLGKVPPPYNGPAIATSILLRSALRHEFDLQHVDTRAHQSVQEIGKWSFTKIIRTLTIYGRLAATLRGSQPALVVIPISQSTLGFAKDSFFILITRALSHKPVIQLRGSSLRKWLAGTNAVVRWYARAVIRATAGAIVLGENLRPLFDGLLPPDRIFVVPNGADYAFPPRTRQQNNEVRFLYVANLKRSKGIEDLIRAVEHLARARPGRFYVDIVGEWCDERIKYTCMQLIRGKALPIAFHGPKHDEAKLAYFINADALVFVPREPEGHPWVIVEAMAAGLPVIATDRGAIRESILDGHNGVLVESDPAAISAAMQRFIDDPQLIRSMGAASRRRHRAYFTEARMVTEMTHVFHKLLPTH